MKPKKGAPPELKPSDMYFFLVEVMKDAREIITLMYPGMLDDPRVDTVSLVSGFTHGIAAMMDPKIRVLYDMMAEGIVALTSREGEDQERELQRLLKRLEMQFPQEAAMFMERERKQAQA